MPDIKCRYAFDENDNLVNIDDVIKEERHLHSYRCIACGNSLLAKIGNIKVPHFAHDKDHACDGETYLHKLAKHRLKERFDKSKSFYISYEAEILCEKIDVCKWKNERCDRKSQYHCVDLKEFYDTATIEKEIKKDEKKYIADVMLTNSKKESNPPILLEILVSHECEQEKKDSGYRIIEFRIKSENDINNLVSQSEFHASPQWEKKKKISFYNFNKKIKFPLIAEVTRFVMSESKPNGYVCYVPCVATNYKVDLNSILELNAVSSTGYDSFDMWDGQRWMWNNKGFRLCGICANYYKEYYENKSVGKCRLSRQVGTPAYPNMRQAEYCKYGRIREDRYSHHDFIVEQVSEINIKEDFKVALIHEYCGDIDRYINHSLFKNACDKFLYEKFSSTKITFIEGFSDWGFEDAKKEKCELNELCREYAYLRNIKVASLKECLVPAPDVKNLFGEIVPSKGKKHKIDNIKDYIDILLSNANALIVIWDESNQLIAQVVEEAKKRHKEILEFDERIWELEI